MISRINQPLLLQCGKILLLMLLYYPCSIGLTFYQKWFLKDFRFPLFSVLMHFVTKFLLAAAIRFGYARITGVERVSLGWRESLLRIAPTGAAASLDIGLSNWSFEYITVSLYTMAKSTSIVFVLIFAVILSIEKLRLNIVCISLLISTGLFLFTFQSTQFELTGFLLVELASACAGMRWTFSQILTQRKECGLSNPVDMIFHIQPFMLLSVLPMFFVFEMYSVALSAQLFYSRDLSKTFLYVCLMLSGGGLAFLMEICEYLVLVQTSSLTLNILGIFKEIVTLLLAHRFHGDKMSVINIAGLMLCIFGISFYALSKSRQDEIGRVKKGAELELRESLLTSEKSSDDELHEEE